MNRKRNIAVIGSYSASEEEKLLAYDLGKHLAVMEINLISGGQKGTMYELCKGASHGRVNSDKQCSIVGIIPSNDFSVANEFVDIVIPADNGAFQNIIVPSSGDLVIAIGGSAGTLAEISFAWQRGKHIALLGSTGWASKLANQAMDSRRNDIMPHFLNVPDLVKWIEDKLQLPVNRP